MTRSSSQDPGYSTGWYDYREQQVCLARWDRGEQLVERVDFDWYFWLRLEDAIGAVQQPEFTDLIEDVVDNGDGWARVYAESGWEQRKDLVHLIRDLGYQSYEADVNSLHRFLTDHPIKFAPDLRVMFWDLETDGRKGWGDIPGHRILSCAWHGHDGDTHFDIAHTPDDTGEGDLIERMLERMFEHDLLVAWNGEKYDEVVLKARCRYHGFRVAWRKINFLDQMQLFQHYYQRDEKASGVRVSFALDNVAKHVLDLGMGKVEGVTDHGVGGSPADRVVWVHRHKPELLEQYNKRDVDLQVAIDEKEEHIEAHRVMSNLCNRFLSTYSLRTGYLGDAFVLRYGGEVGHRFPTKLHTFFGGDKEWRDRVKKKIAGAYVLDPEVGLHENVQLIDFASLYPSIIRTFNISPETICGRPEDKPTPGDNIAVSANGAAFRTDTEGVFPAIVDIAVRERAPYKKVVKKLEEAGEKGCLDWLRSKHISDAYKVLSNTMYGILAATYLRYYDRDCGEAVTLTGQYVIKMVDRHVRNLGYQTIAGDTDSVFVLCQKEDLDKLLDAVHEEVDQWVKERGGKPGLVRLEHDATYTRIVMVSKKHYAGKIEGVEDPDVKGLEYIRTDNCRYVRELQRRIIHYVLEAPNPNPETAARIAAKWQDRIYDGQVPIEDLVVTQGMSKAHPDEYDVSQPHIEVARKMLERGLEIYGGMKIPYILVGTEDGKLLAEHASHEDAKPDARLYWERKIYPATRRILESAWPHYPWGELAKRVAGQVRLFGRRTKR